ncbi:Tetratricopeptide repeat (TPR)-like superfamily protein [Euphorbia peplus]|nr:Tetratricopeptide repeat (TPR)-like superfamily protein [Euphorbia peplus]
MNYAHRFGSLVREMSGNSFFSKFHSKANRTHKMRSSTSELYRRITPIGDPKVSIVPVLDQWVNEGRSAQWKTLKDIIRELRSYRRYGHALEVSMWMTDKQHYLLTPSDVAIRLFLVSKAQGIEQVEKHFDNISEKMKDQDVYTALLNCYATAECVEKAESVMQEMRDLGFASKPIVYNVMLTLYCKTKNVEKFDALLKEMEENGVVPNRITQSIELTAYAAVMDIKGIDKIVLVMESDPKVLDWTSYIVAATGYRKAGRLDKALEMLKKAEARVPKNGRYLAYYDLISHYAKVGRRDDVVRLWLIYKKRKVYNKGYMCVLRSLVMLGDFEMAEQIFNEWELQDLPYDMHIPNIMIGAYTKKGILEKAESVLDRAISKGGKPDAWTWYNLVEGYLENDQSQTVEMMKKKVKLLRAKTRWKLDVACLKGRLKYLKDAEKTEEFVKQLLDDDFFSLDGLQELSVERDERLSCN